MFLHNLKNIFECVKNNKLYDAEKYANNLRNYIYFAQFGGTSEFDKIIREDLGNVIEKYNIRMSNVELLIEILNFIRDYIGKLNPENLEKINALIEEMKVILEKRLEK